MVDAADREKIEASRNELHNLLDKPQLQGIPVSNIALHSIKLAWGNVHNSSSSEVWLELLRRV